MRPTVSPEEKMYPSGLNSASACPKECPLGLPRRLPKAAKSHKTAGTGQSLSRFQRWGFLPLFPTGGGKRSGNGRLGRLLGQKVAAGKKDEITVPRPEARARSSANFPTARSRMPSPKGLKTTVDVSSRRGGASPR